MTFYSFTHLIKLTASTIQHDPDRIPPCPYPAQNSYHTIAQQSLILRDRNHFLTARHEKNQRPAGEPERRHVSNKFKQPLSNEPSI